MTGNNKEDRRIEDKESVKTALEDPTRLRGKAFLLFNMVDDWLIYTHGTPRLPFDDWLISVRFLLRDNPAPSQTLTFSVETLRRLISTLTTELGLLEKHWKEQPESIKRLHGELKDKYPTDAPQNKTRKSEGDRAYT